MAKEKGEYGLYSRPLMKGKNYRGRSYVPISGLPSRQGGVEAIQAKVEGMINGAREADYKLFITAQLSNLKVLRSQCLKQEQLFYNEFGIKDLKDLQSRFDKLMAKGYWALSNINLDGILKKIQDLLGQKLDTILIDMYNNSNENINMAIFHDPKLTADIYDRISKILAPMLKNAFGAMGSRNTGYQMRESEKFTIDNYVHIVEKEGRLQLAKIKDLTPHMRERLLITFLAQENKFHEKLTMKEVSTFLHEQAGRKTFLGINIKSEIQRVVREALPNKAEAGAVAAITREIEDNFANYAINRSASSVKGFLGEVQFSTMIKQMFPAITGRGERQLYEYFATGSMVDVKHGRSFGVDATLLSVENLLQRFNFQVKNVALAKSDMGTMQWTDHKTTNVKDFMDRAGISGSSAIADFYGSWGFNQPFLPNEALGAGYPGGFPSVFAKFPEIAGKMDKIFLAYADKIMRIDQVFQSKDSELFPMGLYINTFFIIAGQFVPGSKLVNGIMESIQSTQVETMIKMTINKAYLAKRPKATMTLYDAILSQAFKPDPIGYHASAGDYSANARLDYTITVDLTRVMSSIF